MSILAPTGERLDAEDPLYQADLIRHRVAYDRVLRDVRGRRVLDLGCGTGYGSAELATAGAEVWAVDQAPPARTSRGSQVRFVRADVGALPFAQDTFDCVVSFQVIEHLEDPQPYLSAIASQLRPEGTAWISTPNVLQSDRENPFHLHEYEADELASLLRRHFADVEMLGVNAAGEAWRYHEARLARIRRITRLDPLGLRRILPRALVDWLFARLSLLVRRGLRSAGSTSRVSADEFSIGFADARSLDLLAVCRRPRRTGSPR